MFFYSENTGPRGPSKIPFHVWRATDRYLDHYSNYLILDAMLRAPRDRAERVQVVKELAICERKLAFWARHPNYNGAEADRGRAALKAAWAK